MEIKDVIRLQSAISDYVAMVRKCEHPEWSNFSEDDLFTQLRVSRQKYFDVIEELTGVRISVNTKMDSNAPIIYTKVK